jgi:hypothetical protein
MGAAFVLFLLPACDKDAEVGSGEKVAVIFAASAGDYEEDAVVVRSAGMEEPETQVISLGDDLFLYATLRPDSTAASGELRAAVAPAEGQQICFSAFNTGTSTLVKSIMYTYTDGELVSDEKMLLEPDVTYDFTAYSYYNNTTDAPAASTINTSKDLVWGRQAGKKITDTNRTVSITMNHLFSKVRLNVKTSITNASIQTLSPVAVSGGDYANLSVYDGKLSEEYNLSQSLTLSTTLPSADIFTHPRPVYPVPSPAKATIKIGTMKMAVTGATGSPFTYSNISIEFNTSLEAGKQYLLEANVKRTRWAWSNIYWDKANKKLTFDTTDKGHEGYQGVFFRWGSLVGISPALTNGEKTYLNTPVIIYVPTYKGETSSTWDSMETTYSTWTVSGGYPFTVPGTDIPYMDHAAHEGSSYTNSNTYAIHADRNTDKVYEGLRGDICQYLSKTQEALAGYRLPRANEFPAGASSWSTTTPTTEGWLKGDGDFTTSTESAGYADGRADLLSTTKYSVFTTSFPSNGAGVKLGTANNRTEWVVLPASGMRYTSGILMNVGSSGYYWSGSAYSAYAGWNLYFGSTKVDRAGLGRDDAAPVRCIRNN